MYPRKTPKTPTTSRNSDRFIPTRTELDVDLANHSLVNGENAPPSNGLLMSPSKEAYRTSLKDSLFEGKSTSSRILTFRAKPPLPKESAENPAKVLYSAQRGCPTSGPSQKATRYIAQTAERVLDAPDLVDDYYLNLLDWNKNNLLVVALASTVYLFNASTGKIDELMTAAPGDMVTSVKWLPEGSHVSLGTNSGLAQLWDVSSMKQIRSLPGHLSRVNALAWNHHILSTGSRDTQIHNHDVRIREHHVSTFSNHTHEVCNLAWNAEGLLASGGNDNVLNIWDGTKDLSSGVVSSPKYSLTEHTAAVKALAWCPWQSNLLASGGGTADRTIKFWNSATGVCLNSIDTESQVCALQWSRHYKELVSSHGYSQNQLIVWKYPTMAKVAELTGHTERVLHMATSPDGQTVVSASADQTLRFWKVWEKTDPASQKTKEGKDTQASRLLMRGRVNNLR